MKPYERVRLGAKLTIFAIALIVAEGLAMMLSFAAALFAFEISPVEFGIFGAITTVVLSEWLKIDAQRAFSVADKSGFLDRNESCTRIRSVKDNCPRSWLVVLHLRLHPELMET